MFFSAIKTEPTPERIFSICHVVAGDMVLEVEIITLDENNLTFHYSLQKPFRPRHSEQTYFVTYDETIYLKRHIIS